MSVWKTGSRLAAVAAVSALLLAACGGGSTTSSEGGSAAASGGASAAASGGAASGEGTPGGTLTILSNAEQLQTLDPQVVYTGEDLAFLGATLHRTLTAFQMSPDNDEGTTLVPDMATDTGTVTNAGKTWAFTLRDGLTWETGDPITCDDIKYGVSRTFDIGASTGGPTYGIAYLDIPTAEDGSSVYKGPSTGEGQAEFDKSITCSGNTITFNLKKPVPDFNYAVTLHAFAPVPKALDTGAEYANKPVSSGPYKVQEYQKGKGGKLVLVRNDKWNPDSDPYRKAYPDQWVVQFGLDETVVDQRLIQSSGEDATAMSQGVLTASLPLMFETGDPAMEGRIIDAFDPYTRYLAVNVEKQPDIKVRQAIGVAMDRAALLKNAGGKFAGDLADGSVKPNIGIDYAPTGLWEGLLGQPVPAEGDPEFAKKLLAEAGKSDLTITYDYPQSEDADKGAAIIVESLKRAGITVKPNPIEAGQYYGVIFKEAGDILSGGWGPDWPNASTVIPPLFTEEGGWDLSRVNDEAFNEKVKAASIELDRNKQATMWQDLNKESVQNMWIIPLRFGRDQRIAGTQVAPVYSWPAYGSWPYAEMYVKQ